jgi:hypothetical protein
MRGEAKVTILQAYCISLPHNTVLWTRTVFTRVLSQLHVSFCLWWKAKLSNVTASSFAWSSVNLLLKPWNASWGFWRTFFKLDSHFWIAFTSQGPLSISWRWQTLGWPSISKRTENVEKIQELINEDHQWTIHVLTDTVGNNYGVCQEILTENLNMRCTASSS